MQEMFVHFVHVQTAVPGRTLGWCFKSCEAHARECLRRDRQADALNRDGNGLPDAPFPLPPTGHPGDETHPTIPLVDEIEIEGELITNDVLVVLLPLLSNMQQQVLFHLMKGCGVREAGRQLGISHPAVIKHRKKIARIAREFLQESEGVGVAVAVHEGAKDNGNGIVNGHGAEHSNSNGDTHQAA